MLSKFSNFPDELSENDELREYELSGSDCILQGESPPPPLSNSIVSFSAQPCHINSKLDAKMVMKISRTSTVLPWFIPEINSMQFEDPPGTVIR